MKSLVLILAIISATAVVIGGLYYFRPQPVKIPHQDKIVSVEVIRAEPIDVDVKVPSQGILEAVTLTRAASEVPGKVIEVSSHFRAGSIVNKGEILLQIDRSDYEAALEAARSTASDAVLALETEKANAARALRDWKTLGSRKKPSDLVLRKPHVAAAEARLAAARAAVTKAVQDLERTSFRAPYYGRVLKRHIDLGTFVGAGTPLGDLYALDFFEVRLPVSVEDFTLLDINENPDVDLSAVVAGKTWTWPARIVREEGAIDRQNRSVYLVAQLPARPESPDTERDRLLQPGLFLQAVIGGKTLKNVVTVPRFAVSEGNRVIVIDGDNTIRLREVTIVYSDEDHIYVSEGLSPDDRICSTVLPEVIEGIAVNIIEPTNAP